MFKRMGVFFSKIWGCEDHYNCEVCSLCEVDNDRQLDIFLNIIQDPFLVPNFMRRRIIQDYIFYIQNENKIII
jgi:hypothetical protein